MTYLNFDESVECLVSNTIYLIVRLLSAVVATIANLLTMIVICKVRSLQTATNVLIFGLALTDISSGIDVILTFMLEDINTASDAFRATCIGREIITFLNICCNVCIICYISIDRVISLTFCFRYHFIVTIKRGIILLAFTVTYCIFLISCCMSIGISKINKFCILLDIIPPSAQIALMVHFFIISGITFVMYCYICYIACKKNSIADPIARFNPVEQRKVTQLKITTMMSCVLGTYFGSYLPVVILVLSFNNFENMSCHLHNAIFGFFYLNTFINPLIYAGSNSHFRHSYKKVLRGMCAVKRNRVQRLSIVSDK